MPARSHFDVEARFRPILKKFYVLFEVTIFLIIMADRAVAVAEAEKKNLGSLRLQEKLHKITFSSFDGEGKKRPRRDDDEDEN